MGGRFMPVVVSFALGKSVHVDLVRLAATPCGFVVPLRPVGSISELFGIEMKWSENRNLPEYLLLVSGFLSDRETPIW